MEMQAEKVFSKMGRNFMTPDWIAYRDVPPGDSPWTKPIGKVVELTRGFGMDNLPIYGVTVRMWDGENTEETRDESQMFHSQKEAADYFQGIT